MFYQIKNEAWKEYHLASNINPLETNIPYRIIAKPDSLMCGSLGKKHDKYQGCFRLFRLGWAVFVFVKQLMQTHDKMQ